MITFQQKHPLLSQIPKHLWNVLISSLFKITRNLEFWEIVGAVATLQPTHMLLILMAYWNRTKTCKLLFLFMTSKIPYDRHRKLKETTA